MAKDRIVIPGIPKDAARVIIERLRETEDRLAQLERKGGRPGVVTTDTVAKVGELLNIEGPSGETITIVLPESIQRRRNARVTLAFRNSNPVRIVCVGGTVNGEAFVLNDRPGTYDATCDGLGGWYVQVGVSDEGSGAGGGGGGGSVTFGVPGSVSLETAASEGVATTAARSDHVHSTTAGTPVAIALANAEGSAATFARSDHVHRDRIGTGSDDGFLSRRVYVNAASSRVGTTIWGQTALAATTLSNASDLPDGNWFLVQVWGSGGSGANGRQRATTVNTNSLGGSSGGGGGAHNWRVFSRAELVAALPIAMTVAADSVATAVATTDDTAHSGTNGGPSHFGDLLSAFGGAGGRQNNTAVSGGTGGGLSHAGVQAVTGTNNLGGGAPVAGVPGYGGYGGASAIASSGGAFSASGGGGGGGAPCASTNSAPGDGGRCGSGGGAGGGAGAGCNSGVVIGSAGNGSAGGLATAGAPSSETGGGGSGGTGALTAPTDGSAGADSTSPTVGGSGGGGGGSGAANAATGGDGGNGGFPAGGGGGGGAARGTAGTARGGLGGTGAGGAILITALA